MRVFSLALVLRAILSAQDTAATIEGRVLDPGRVISGATVRATNSSTGYTRSQITSSERAFSFTPSGLISPTTRTSDCPTTIWRRRISDACWKRGRRA